MIKSRAFYFFHTAIKVIPAFFGPLVYFAMGGKVNMKLIAGATFCFFLFDSLGVQIGVHKLLAHRAFGTKKIIKWLLASLSVLSGQGSPLFWVAVHMGSHHPHADTEKDVHSPIHGLFHSFIGWYWNTDFQKLSFKTAKEYISDPVLIFLHKYHNRILLLYWAGLLALGIPYLVFCGFIPVALSITLVGLVNALTHSRNAGQVLPILKYQNHPNNTAYNCAPLGFLTMGLGLHNNHHNDPSNPFNDEKWYEIDLSRWIIPLIRTSKIDR